MIKKPGLKPNELIYIPIGNLQPFISDLEIPVTQMRREKNKILGERYASTLPEVVFDQASSMYFVIGGYSTYYAYSQLYKPNRLIPCKAFYELFEDERYLLTLAWMMKNNITNWYNRYDIITKLMIAFHYSKEEIATFLNREPKDIQLYLDPPPNVQQRTLQQRKEKIINKISLEAFKHSHNKDYLYILVLYFGHTITHEQLKFISWLRGNDIRFEERQLTLEQEHQLIDKALNLKEEFLNEIRLLIQEMQKQNEDKPMI